MRPTVSWAQWLVIVTTVLPFLAAAAARRLSPRDPVGQVGLAWGAQFLCGLASTAAFLAGRFSLIRYFSVAASVLIALMLAPPLLTWLGPRARGWWGAALGATAVWASLAMALVDLQRGFNLAFRTPAFLLLLALSTAVLAAQARLAGDPIRDASEPGWQAIAGGHALYFLTGSLSGPLREFMVPNGLDVVRQVAMATQCLYAIAMAVVAWGLWQSRVPHAILPDRNTDRIPTLG